MSVLDKIACMQNRRDEQPNEELAAALVKKKDKQGIQEIAANLWNADPRIAHDCIKVIYEVGEQDPALISRYADDFLRLIGGKDNRMIWGAITALATIAPLVPDLLFEHLKEIETAVANGSVITQDRGILTLAVVGAHNDRYRKAILPFLLKHLGDCRPKDVPQHSESTLMAIDERHGHAFVRVLEERLRELSPPQQKRVMKVIQQIEEL